MMGISAGGDWLVISILRAEGIVGISGIVSEALSTTKETNVLVGTLLTK
jgi:hypothetical protein